MAYVKKREDEIEQLPENKTTPGNIGGPVSISPTGGVIAGQTPNPSAPNQPNQHFATLQTYLDANKTQGLDLANKISGNLATQVGTAGTAVAKAGQDITGQIEAGVVKPDTEFISKTVANPYGSNYDTLTNLFKDTNQAISKTNVPIEKQALTQSAVAQANKVTGGGSSLSQEDQQKLAEQKNLTYKGPGEIKLTPEYQKALQAIAIPKESVQLSKTEGGRKQLVENTEKIKTPGITGFNQALLSMVPEAAEKIRTAGEPYNKLAEDFNKTTTELETQRKAKVAENPELGKKAIGEAVQKEITNLQTRVQQKFNEDKSAPGQVNDTLEQGIRTGNLSEDQVMLLGGSPREFSNLKAITNMIKQNYGQDFNLLPYFSPAAPQSGTLNQNDFAAPEDYAYYQALTSLIGDTQQLSQTPGGGYGKFSTPSFDFNRALIDAQNALSTLDNNTGRPLVGTVSTPVGPSGNRF